MRQVWCLGSLCDRIAVGTVAAVGGVLREVVRRRTGGKSKSRSRSPGNAAARADGDDGTNSGSEGGFRFV